MSESQVVLAAELPDFEPLYPILEHESPEARQALFLEFVDEQFDSEYDDDLVIEDIAIEGGRLLVEFQCSTGLSAEITQALFEGLAEHDADGMAALDYDGRIGVYAIFVPGYDEAENVEECFEEFDGMMHDLEEMMDRREQLVHVLELMENEPVRSRLREYLGEEEQEALGLPTESLAEDDDDAEPSGDSSETRGRSNETAPDHEELMAQLKKAMAVGDEARVEELFRQIQNTP
jgi:hypothetical protein